MLRCLLDNKFLYLIPFKICNLQRFVAQVAKCNWSRAQDYDLNLLMSLNKMLCDILVRTVQTPGKLNNADNLKESI